MIRRPARAALLLLVTVAAVWLYAHEGHAPLPAEGLLIDRDKGEVALSPEAREALGVATAEADVAPLAEEIVAPATLVSPWGRHGFASARLGGRVAALHVRPGQAVTRGQLLAEVQSLELDQLLLELRTAENEARLAADSLRALEERREAVAEQLIVEARTQHQEAQIGVEIARRKLLLLGLPEESLRPGAGPLLLPVRSPIAGTLIHADVRLGQVVEAGEHLFEAVDLSEVWAQVAVLEKDLPRVAVGQPLLLRLAAHGEATFPSRVEGLGLALEEPSKVGAVWARFAGADSALPLLPGMTGEARLRRERDRKAVAVPASALVSLGAERFVFVETGPGQYARRNVVVLRAEGDRAHVALGGVLPAERVLTSGSHELASYFEPEVLRLSPEAERSIGLRVELAQRRRVAEVVTLLGTIDLPPDRRTVAAARLPGAIQAIHVQRDQVVKAGDVVAEVATPELHTLQLDLLRADLQTRLGEEALARLEALGRAVSTQKRRELESSTRAARLRRDAAAGKLRALGLTEESLRRLTAERRFVEALPVRAPLTGAVVRFPRALGQSVKAEEPLFEAHDFSGAWALAYASERDLGRLQLGQRVRVSLPSRPGFVADAVLRRSARALDPADRTLTLWAEFIGTPPPLPPAGTLARVTVVVADGAKALTVPRDAIIQEGSSEYLFVRQPDGSWDRRRVRTGRSDDQWAEVVEGLREGERVAAAGAAELMTAHAAIR